MEELVNEHLLAEYRELPRTFGYVRRLQHKGGTPFNSWFPERYTMGEGHVRFFYPRLQYLVDRHAEICLELRIREYHLSFTDVKALTYDLDDAWFGDWWPDSRDLSISYARIRERLLEMR